ncbi:AgmX/PglI C-terminal domain-containing protein [Labilithrix luteola]|nr:AgmX/PglI C-terminal domain-containing protein [Labilithrix luteola]
MRKPLVTLALVGALLGCIVGCGGGGANTTASAPSAADAGPETFAEVNPADVAALQATADAGPTAPSSGAAPSSAPASSTPAPAPEPKDECTPVGVDFEQRARPKLKECYREGKKKNPNLEGKVRITVDIDTLGKIKSTKITEKTLPDPVAQCMLKVVKATPLPDAAKCSGKAITIPLQFPTPH